MNKYAIFEWYENQIVEKILVEYKDKAIIYGDKKEYLAGVRLIYPELTNIIDIIGDFWKWKDEIYYSFFYMHDTRKIFEAPDDESAKLIFEVS